MIMVTGGAGFIGSILHASLAARGIEAVVVDWLGDQGKWRNLAKHPPARLIRPDALDAYLASDPPLEAIIHMGAVSETTATDGEHVWATNVELPTRLWRWCAPRGVRLLYASSAATYGDGAEGFEDGLDELSRLRPLNLYGWTKHVFDLRVRAMLAAGEPRPPQWAGLKFFNVFGPNEYHKGPMISVVKVKFDEIMAGGAPRLFRSDRRDVRDGEQARDFIWVGDVVDVIMWLLETPSACGLFNVGTGRARTYLDLAHALCDALDRPRRVEFIEMPAKLRGSYQSFTQASTDRLRAAGFSAQFTPLEKGIRRYVQEYMTRPDPYV